MALEDWLVDGGKGRSGGQGSVRRVVRADGCVGALKVLHSGQSKETTRRFRMHSEAMALRALKGDKSVPALLDDNVNDWEDPEVELFIVMEWIEGPTLTTFIADGLPLDVALPVIRTLLETVQHCHDLGLQHRDLKSDNVIMRDGSPDAPVLVDFGMSWALREGDDLRTHDGQEIGNRSLRLPEFAPGNHLQDPRSDFSMLVGLLFQMVTGRPARILLDGAGNPPHARAGMMPASLTEDRRWPKLRWFFNQGFQTRLDRRFQSIAEMHSALADLEPSGDEDEAELERTLAEAEEFLRSEETIRLDERDELIRTAASAFWESLRNVAERAGLYLGASGPDATYYGRCNSMNFELRRTGIQKPTVYSGHTVEIDDNGIRAFITVGRETTRREYYSGPTAAVDALLSATKKEGRVMAGFMVKALSNQIEVEMKGG